MAPQGYVAAPIVTLFHDERDAAMHALSQDGASNCGETAVHTALRALDVPPSSSGRVVVRPRDHTRDLLKYLRARAVAGCTAEDLVDGAHALSNEQVVAAFFPVGPEAPAGLAAFLARWTEAGAAAIVTINTQLDGADYWHHQAVLAVRPEVEGREAEIMLGNPVEWVREAELARLMASESVLLVRAEDVLCRCPPTDDDLQRMSADPAYAARGVAEQISGLLDRRPSAGIATHVAIPASYVPGVTVIAPKRLCDLAAKLSPGRAGGGAAIDVNVLRRPASAACK